VPAGSGRSRQPLAPAGTDYDVTRDEGHTFLKAVDRATNLFSLIAKLIYGAGPQLMECFWLSVRI
jgi:hypothetical protein